ncbi:galactose oxidase early set domain-containing protein [Streptomyces sp. RerS4]|uniref:galactose oxidase early set domain-containing protein n=1 Tax=Streptomyces sp. RerS4 TaxID=2942449 RepID=UPI00201C68A1|nr:galactose oxidase early set domain-containing protein [Streptomyces sp. RerS4]UQX02712.1 galactose oxidase early set domain-containing protein [Streptomyces sp. RerS4]
MRRKIRRRAGRRAALTAVGAMTAALLLSAPQPAVAGPPNLLTNPGFETAGAPGADMPDCWSKSGWGNNDFTFATVPDAHTGTKAMRVSLTRRVDGDRKALVTESATCAPTVIPGKQYDLSAWYKSNTPDVSVTVFRHDTTAGWQYWTDLRNPPVSAAWARTEVRTPAVPPNTDKIAWGLSVYGVGTVTTDDYALEEVGAAPPQPTCTGTAEQCAKGKWDVIPAQNPVRSMHAVVLKNGKVLLIAGSGNDIAQFNAGTFTSAVYDPANGTFKSIPTPVDMFCSGHVQLADGRVLVMSGNKGYPSADGKIGYQGLKDSYVFDPATETYTKTNDMNGGHWYPSATILGNGDVISFGGLKEDSTGNVTAEKFSAAQNKWLPMNEVNQTWSYWGLYPSMILMQDGRLFYSGSHTFGNGTPGSGASVYDYDANTITDVPGLRRKDERDESASVLLPPAQDQRVLTIGGGNNETNPAANRLTDIIDLKQPSPAYTAGPDLPQGLVDTGTGKRPQTAAEGKMYVSAVLLPDGKVLETGGGLHDRADPVFEASFFDPTNNTYQPGLATDPIPRTYHSAAFLLPDGRVMAVGDNPGNGTYNHAVSIYTPPYLFKGPRPQLTSVIDTDWIYGDTQRITVNRPIAKAELIRPAAVTHSSDPNQRFVDLPMTVVNDTTVDLNVTSNPNLAPPGWYMLFGVDAAGIPSVATWVHLGGAPALRAAGEQHPSAHEHTFANDLAAPKPNPARRDSAPVAPTVAGCDRHYGTASLCVPTNFPAEVKKTTRARCDWLAAHQFPKRMKVNGSDPLRLDADGDGYTC